MGKGARYTPDALIHYTDESGLKPVLCEIKLHDELAACWKDYRPRFKAAVRLWRREGWVFHIYTDREIRTPYLDNVRFLRDFRRITPDEFKKVQLRRFLGAEGETSVAERGPWLSLLWHLIATGEMRADLGAPLDYETRVSMP